MSKNKLTLENQFLTFIQTKELKELGIEFSNTNWCYDTQGNLHCGNNKEKPFPQNMINTLSVAEMLEILPKSFYTEKDEEDDNDIKEEYCIFYNGHS